MVSVNDVNSESTQTKNDEEKKKTFKKMSMRERLAYMKEVITIEPLICCVVTAKMISGPALSNLHFEKACKVNAGFNDTVCDAIVSGTYLKLNFREQNDEVQSYLTHLRSWEVPVSSVIPVLLVLFLGSYSDRHKIRKPFMLMPIFGDIVAVSGSILNVFYMYEWPLEVQAIADRVIPSIFGAEKLIIMASYAYIADISSVEMRTVRMAVIPILLSVCIPVIQAVSGIMFRALGYIPILGISFGLFVFSFIYGMFVIKEPRECKEDKKNLIADIFNLKHAVDTFKLVTKNKGSQRTGFICVLVLCFIHTMVSSGEFSAFFLFVQTAYQWTVVDFSYYITAATIVNFVGLSVAVPLFAKVFRLNDAIIIAIAYLDAILTSAVVVIVNSSLGLYIGCALAVLIPPGQAATRSQLTKYVSRDDMAKALSLNTIVSAIAATVSAQIYHQGIYEHTRKTFPQAFLLFGIGVHLIGVVILIWMYYREKKNPLIIIEDPIGEKEKDAKDENENDSIKKHVEADWPIVPEPIKSILEQTMVNEKLEKKTEEIQQEDKQATNEHLSDQTEEQKTQLQKQFVTPQSESVHM